MLVLGLGLATVLALVGGVAVGAARSDREAGSLLPAVLVVVGVLGLVVALTATLVRVLRRRGVDVVSPLWGADRRTRTRVVRAMKTQEELTGTDRYLALAEATRSRRLAPVFVTLLLVAGALILAGVGLRLADGASSRQLVLSLAQLVLLTVVAGQQTVFYRRAVAYLARFGAQDQDGAGSSGDTGVV